MAKYGTLSALLGAIADAIRSKTGGESAIAAEDFPDAISGIVTGSGFDTSERLRRRTSSLERPPISRRGKSPAH